LKKKLKIKCLATENSEFKAEELRSHAY